MDVLKLLLQVKPKRKYKKKILREISRQVDYTKINLVYPFSCGCCFNPLKPFMACCMSSTSTSDIDVDPPIRKQGSTISLPFIKPLSMSIIDDTNIVLSLSFNDTLSLDNGNLSLRSPLVPLTLNSDGSLGLNFTSPFNVTANSLSLSYENGLSVVDDKLALLVGNGFEFIDKILNLKIKNGLGFSDENLVINIGNGLTLTNDNKLTLFIGGGLDFDFQGKLTLKLGSPLVLDSNNVVQIALGSGLENSNGSLGLNLGQGLAFSDDKVSLLNPLSPLSFSNDSLKLNLGNGLVSSDDTLNVNVADGLIVNSDNKIQLNLGNGLSFDQNKLTIQAASPILSSPNGISLQYGDGLTLANDSLVANVTNPLMIEYNFIGLKVPNDSALTVDSSGLKLSLGTNSGLVVRNNALNIAVSNAGLSIENNTLGLKVSSPLQLLNGSITMQSGCLVLYPYTFLWSRMPFSTGTVLSVKMLQLDTGLPTTRIVWSFSNLDAESQKFFLLAKNVPFVGLTRGITVTESGDYLDPSATGVMCFTLICKDINSQTTLTLSCNTTTSNIVPSWSADVCVFES